MGVTNRELILSGVLDKLEDIDGTGDFKTTLAGVDRHITDPDQLGSGSRPRAQFAPLKGARPPTHNQGGSRFFAYMGVAVCGHVEAATEAALSEAIANLEDDIIAALANGPTEGAYESDWKLVDEPESTEGLPDMQDENGLWVGALWMIFECSYERARGHTT